MHLEFDSGDSRIGRASASRLLLVLVLYFSKHSTASLKLNVDHDKSKR